ncbi:hypothetical protein HDU76_011943, partial [Blyttiomyces sp. JEL0837]
AQTLNQSTNGDLAQLPTTQLYQTGGLIFQHVTKSSVSQTGQGSLDMIIVAGAPITDYTAEIEQTRSDLRDRLSKNTSLMLMSAVAIAVFFSILSIPLTDVLVGRPMRRLDTHMRELAKFDFSSLKGIDKNLRSWVKEI